MCCQGLMILGEVHGVLPVGELMMQIYCLALKKLPKHGKWKLVVDLVDANPSRSVVKVMVNSAEKKFEIKGIRKEYWRVIFKMPRNKFLNFQFQPMI